MALTKASYSMITGAPVNILDFGADNTGVADSSAAIQAAILQTYATGGGAIYCPAGEYKLNTTITFPEDYYIKFFGDGSLCTRFVFKGSGNAMQAASNTTNKIKVCFEGFWLYNDSANSTNGIFIKNCQYESNVEDVFVDSFNKAGTQTIDGYTFYYSGIVAMYCWGLTWNNVETRRNGNGVTLVNFNSTLTGLNSLVNNNHGAYIIESSGPLIGGVFQGNHVLIQNDPADVRLAGEVVCMGGSMSLQGCYFEGEGTNPPWSIIIDGFDAQGRSQGATIQGCRMNRTQNTDQTRGGILVRFAEETIIEGNEIMPTFIYGTGSSTIPHIYLDPRSLNTRIGHNSYRGRHVFTGSLYAWYAPIINTTNLPQYDYPNATSDGGLKTIQKRLRLEWLLPAATLAAPLGETYANIPGTTLVSYHSLTRSVWLTNIQAILPAGMSAGTFTVKVYNRENDAGSLMLIKQVTATPEAGIQFALLNQHPYIDKLLPGTVLVTVETSAAFAPTASNEIYVELEFEEFDNH